MDPDDTRRPAGRSPTVLVVTGGEGAHPALRLPSAELVVAADSGADVALRVGLEVDVLVGDMDSVAETTRARLALRGARIEAHPRDKDATDLELALGIALDHDPGRLVVVGGHGGRLDHSWAALGLMAATSARVDHLEAWMGPAQVVFAGGHRAPVDLPTRRGEVVSLVPVGGKVQGVTTDGLRWSLEDATLPAGSGWGMSNEAVAPPVRVRARTGTLAVVRPHALTPEADVDHRVPGAGRPPGREA